VWTGPEIGRTAAEILRLLAESRTWNGQCVEQASSEAVAVHKATGAYYEVLGQNSNLKISPYHTKIKAYSRTLLL
jgi:hypothetical protein